MLLLEGSEAGALENWEGTDERGLPAFYTAAGGLAGGLARRPMRGGENDEWRAPSRFGARAVALESCSARRTRARSLQTRLGGRKGTTR